MPNLEDLFRNWYGHILESVIRLNQYFSERAAAAPDAHWRVIGKQADRRFSERAVAPAGGYGGSKPGIFADLLDSLDGLASFLREKAAELLVDDAVAENWDTYYVSARDAVARYRSLHNFVTCIPTSWPSSELDLFIRQILEEAQDGHVPVEASSSWTILLTAEYNFSHSFVAIEGYPGQKTSDLRSQHLLSLPGAEKDNPIMWTNLVHEIAHDIAAEARVVTAACALPSVNKHDAKTRELLRDWIPEIAADLLAADYLGPAYFGAFVAFAAYWIPYALQTPSLTHPSVSSRVKYLRNRIENRMPAFASDLNTPSHRDYDMRLTLDYRHVDMRNKLFDKIRFHGLTGITEAEEALPRIVSDIVELPEYKAIVPRQLGGADAQIINALQKRLLKGELIASRRDPTSTRMFESPEQVRLNFVDALGQLKDSPNDVRQILNAAVLVKLGMLQLPAHPMTERSKIRELPDRRKKRKLLHNADDTSTTHQESLLKDFCDSSEPFVRKQLVNLRRKVTSLDSLVSRSLEAMIILKFFADKP